MERDHFLEAERGVTVLSIRPRKGDSARDLRRLVVGVVFSVWEGPGLEGLVSLLELLVVVVVAGGRAWRGLGL